MKKLLFSLTHLLAACSGSKNRDGMDSQIQKETNRFIMIVAGDLACINRNGLLKAVNLGYGLVIHTNACYVSFR